MFRARGLHVRSRGPLGMRTPRDRCAACRYERRWDGTTRWRGHPPPGSDDPPLPPVGSGPVAEPGLSLDDLPPTITSVAPWLPRPGTTTWRVSTCRKYRSRVIRPYWAIVHEKCRRAVRRGTGGPSGGAGQGRPPSSQDAHIEGPVGLARSTTTTPTASRSARRRWCIRPPGPLARLRVPSRHCPESPSSVRFPCSADARLSYVPSPPARSW